MARRRKPKQGFRGAGKSQRTVFRHHRVTPSCLPPGPTRRYDRRHFGRMGMESTFVLVLLGLVVLSFFLVEFGLMPDWLGWK